MKYSQLFIPTVKEVPADAEVASHRLMIRAALMRRVASGTYVYLPLGNKILLKVIQIVREEMNRAGAQEILVPCLQPLELWQQTGRAADYGETMFRIEDRHGRWSVLGPTAEEVFTSMAAGEIKSYKQLPINLYQISNKFRDEFRPRFGVIRSREFIMKDAYSFDADAESLHESYMAMYNAYRRIFERCGIEYVIVVAESGEMGGSGSHQFTVPCESGEDTIVYTEDGSYAANLEKAAVDPLPKQPAAADTPAPEDVHTPNVGTIEAVCDFLKTKPQDMIKTLIYWSPSNEEVAKIMAEYAATHRDGGATQSIRQSLAAAGPYQIYAVLVRGDHEVNPEKLTTLLGPGFGLVEYPSLIKEITGADVGFAGPIGLSDEIDGFVIDHAVAAMAVGVAGANKTDYHTKNVVPGRDFPLEGDNITIADLRIAVEGDTLEGKPLLFRKGIEVGQVFKLGTKYSTKLGAKFLDEQGHEQPCLMGCYGIGINRIVASAVELGNDKNGIIWPISIAPFEVIITSVNQDDDEVAAAANRIYTELLDKGIDVLLDDRVMRAGVKFKDADLLGIPVRVTVGKRSLAEGNVEIKLRRDADGATAPLDKASDQVAEIVSKLKKEIADAVTP